MSIKGSLMRMEGENTPAPLMDAKDLVRARFASSKGGAIVRPAGLFLDCLRPHRTTRSI